MVYLVLQPATGSLTYANAGHWPVLIYHPDRPLRRLPNTGPALGIFRDLPIEIAHAALEPGDIAVAYTDGLLDALSLTDVEEGHRWLVEQLAGLAALPAHEIAHAILDQARPSAEEARRDDQTVMVIKRS
jgi:sigma-B regulation protein RsbU (phosphoserine phosphatase)